AETSATPAPRPRPLAGPHAQSTGLRPSRRRRARRPAPLRRAHDAEVDAWDVGRQGLVSDLAPPATVRSVVRRGMRSSRVCLRRIWLFTLHERRVLPKPAEEARWRVLSPGTG